MFGTNFFGSDMVRRMYGRRGGYGGYGGYGAYANQQQRRNLTSDKPIEDLERFASDELNILEKDQGGDFESALRGQAERRGMEKRATKARENAETQSRVAENVFRRQTEGMDLSARQQAGAKQRLSLNREVTRAAASTGVRRTAAQTARAADRNFLALEDMKFGQLGAMLGSLANAEGQRLVAEENRKANKKAKKSSLLGTVIGGALAFFSAEEYKDKVEEAPKLLDKLKEVRVDKWKYKGMKPEHIGPYAEEFNKTFGVGSHKDTIDVVSLLGVTLGAVKELNEKVEAQHG